MTQTSVEASAIRVVRTLWRTSRARVDSDGVKEVRREMGIAEKREETVGRGTAGTKADTGAMVAEMEKKTIAGQSGCGGREDVEKQRMI